MISVSFLLEGLVHQTKGDVLKQQSGGKFVI
jgi:hypothetical protein